MGIGLGALGATVLAPAGQLSVFIELILLFVENLFLPSSWECAERRKQQWLQQRLQQWLQQQRLQHRQLQCLWKEEEETGGVLFYCSIVNPNNEGKIFVLTQRIYAG